MTHRGMHSAAPAAAPECRAAGRPGFLTAPASSHQPRPRPPARDVTVAGVPAAHWEARASDGQSRSKERPHACHPGLSLVSRSS